MRNLKRLRHFLLAGILAIGCAIPGGRSHALAGFILQSGPLALYGVNSVFGAGLTLLIYCGVAGKRCNRPTPTPLEVVLNTIIVIGVVALDSEEGGVKLDRLSYEEGQRLGFTHAELDAWNSEVAKLNAIHQTIEDKSIEWARRQLEADPEVAPERLTEKVVAHSVELWHGYKGLLKLETQSAFEKIALQFSGLE